MPDSKLLIAIPTCTRYVGNETSSNRQESERRAACRDTWLKDCPVDYRLFYGQEPGAAIETASDEVVLPIHDGYDNLSHKFREMCRWALDHNYDFLFRVDTDAYVYVDRLIKSGYEQHDYSGFTIDYPEHLGWARYCSGAGWTLSRRAMETVANNRPDHPADDLWTGRTLQQHGFPCHRDTRYLCGFEPHFIPLDRLPRVHPYIVLHALTPDGIREVHRRGSPGEDITPPAKPIFEPDFNFEYGRKSADCLCSYCQ